MRVDFFFCMLRLRSHVGGSSSLLCDFVIVILVRLASFYGDQPKPGEQARMRVPFEHVCCAASLRDRFPGGFGDGLISPATLNVGSPTFAGPIQLPLKLVF